MDEWEALRAAVNSCTKCRLHEGRNKAVLGEGPLNAEIMLIGEAPGAQEDLEGRPFVGAAGKLLNDMLAAAGLRRSDLYITNVVKCRPPGNREPLPDEEGACLPYLLKQVALIKPKLIITMGRHSSAAILSIAGADFNNLADVRGKLRVIEIAGVESTVLPTYHPAASIYNPSLKKAIEEDLKVAASFISGRRPSLLDFIGDEERRQEH